MLEQAGARRAPSLHALAAALLPFCASAAHADPALRLVGVAPITAAPALTDREPERSIIGGISGLAFDPSTDTWLAVSDADASRARQLRLTATDAGATAEIVALEPIAAHAANNAEAIARAFDGSWLIAHESPASVFRFDRDLAAAHELAGARAAAEGLATNRTWEALTVLLTEPPTVLLISEFGPAATPVDPTSVRRSRAVLLNLDTGAELARGEYAITPPPGLGGAGVTEIAALDASRFLALERRVTPRGYGAALFLVEVTRAGAALSFTKTPLGSLRTLGVANPGNAEAMALGPPAADGSRRVVIMNDDNLGRDGQRGTRTIVLQLDP